MKWLWLLLISGTCWAQSHEILRPTVDIDGGSTVSISVYAPCGVGGTLQNGSIAQPNWYDNAGLTTSSLLEQLNTSSVGGRCSNRVVKSWSSSSNTYTSLTLNINTSGGCNTVDCGIETVSYSLDGGATWHSVQSGTWAQVTNTVTLSTSQNLSNIWVAGVAYANGKDVDHGDSQITGFDVWTDGTYIPPTPTPTPATVPVNPAVPQPIIMSQKRPSLFWALLLFPLVGLVLRRKNMRRFLWFLILVLPMIASGQNIRFDSTALSSKGIQGQQVITPGSGAIITVCTSTATGIPCSPQVTTYNGPTTGTACPGSTQVTLPNSTLCQANADINGNFGFWLPAGNYTYSISGPGLVGQLYSITPAVNSGGSPTFSAITVTGTATLPTITGPTTINGTLTTTGPVFTTTFNNTCYANQQAGADLGAKINACIALGSNTDILITASGTVTTPIVINGTGPAPRNNIAIRGIGTGSAVALINGITGTGAQCAITISGTAAHILLQDIEVDGNNLTGASGNGNGICINGTGPTPNSIWLIRAGAQFNKGTGLNSSASQIPATGLYMAGVVDVYVDMGFYGANQVGIFTDNGTNHAEIRRTGIFQNVKSAWQASGAGNAHILVGPGNDWEGNGALITDHYINVDACQMCSFWGNWLESNSGDILFSSTARGAQIDFYDNIIIHGANGSTPATTDAITDAANVDLNIHDNYWFMQQTMTGIFLFNPSANASVGKRMSGNITDFASGSMNGFAVGWVAGTHAGKCIFDGNSFGSVYNTTFNGSAGNAAIDIGAGESGCQVRGTSCHNGSGTLANCVKVETSASLTYVADTQISGGGVTTAVNNGGSFTTCFGSGCSGGGSISTQTIQTSTGTNLFIHGLNAGGGGIVFGASGNVTMNDGGTLVFGAGSQLNFTNLLMSPTAPTIAGAGCGGTVATISANNGTSAFSIFTGTTPTTACTVTMPSATTGWICDANTVSATSTTNFVVKQTGAVSQTSVVLTNFNDVAVPANFGGSDTVRVKCVAY